jgi:hypothetical protein
MTESDETMGAKPLWKKKRFYQLGALFFGPVVAALIGVWATSGDKAPLDQGHEQVTHVNQGMVANQQVIVQIPPVASASPTVSNASNTSSDKERGQTKASSPEHGSNPELGSGTHSVSTANTHVKPADSSPVRHAASGQLQDVQTQGPCSPAFSNSSAGNISISC